MKCTLIVNSLPDILFIWADQAFTSHVNKVFLEAGYVDDQHDDSEINTSAASQYFSPMITTLSYMKDQSNPYTSVSCEDGMLIVFKEFDDLIFIAVNGSGEESEEFLKRKLSFVNKLATMYYGPALDLIKSDLPSVRKRSWKRFGGLIDTWEHLCGQQQSFLVEAVEKISVNQSLSEMSIGLLNTALTITRNGSDQNAVHALLVVNTKLLALYSSRHASELEACDILMITVFIHNIFPYTSQATPQVYNRTSPQQAHRVVKTGDPSDLHHLFEGPSAQNAAHERTRSAPVRVPARSCKDESHGSLGSSADDKFYSPPSTPPSASLGETAQASSGIIKETFFTPRATTPDRHMADDAEDSEQAEEVPTEDARDSDKDTEQYYRQPVFLHCPKCPYIPHLLHFVRITTGTVLVLVSEAKNTPLAVSIYQALNTLSQIELTTEGGQRTLQQAQGIVERLETYVKKIFDILRTPAGVTIENQVRTVRQRWELVKRRDFMGFLASLKSVEMSPQLESALTEMSKSLKSLFSVMFCTGRGAVAPVSTEQLNDMSLIQNTLQKRLQDYEDYLLVKGQRNVTMTAYLEDFPGLVHFIYVDRTGDQVTAPSINTTADKIHDTRDPCHVLKQKIWDMWSNVHTFLQQGHTFVAIRDGDFLFTYCLWFEDSSGNVLVLQGPLPLFPDSQPTGVSSGAFYKTLTQRCFPNSGAIRCYELMCVHLGLVPVRFAARHIRRLAAKLFESAVGAHSLISLIQ